MTEVPLLNKLAKVRSGTLGQSWLFEGGREATD